MQRERARVKPNVLALDLGGVVYLSWPNDEFHRRWSERCGCSPGLLAQQFWSGPHWALAELGQITPDECFAQVAERVGIPRDMVREVVVEAFASHPDEALARYVDGVRARGVTVAALTNNCLREAELFSMPELARLFDLAISSADSGLAKPDLAFYRHAEARLGAHGDKVVFLDDVSINVDGARELGWRAFQFTTTADAMKDVEAALFEGP